MFTGTFYFDSYFWPVHIPIAYGTVSLDPLDFLDGMPNSVKCNLSANRQTLVEYVLLWTNCLDYSYGFDDITKTGACRGFGAELVISADRELRAVVELLTKGRGPNPKAMESARMCTEMFLKAYLALHGDLDEKKAKDELGHDLSLAAERCLAIGSTKEFELLRQDVRVFPPVQARYKGKDYSLEDLWRGYFVAQTSAVIFIRSLTDRDSRGQLFLR